VSSWSSPSKTISKTASTFPFSKSLLSSTNQSHIPPLSKHSKSLRVDARIQGVPIVIDYAGHEGEILAPESELRSKVQVLVLDYCETPEKNVPAIPDRTIRLLIAQIVEKKGDNICQVVPLFEFVRECLHICADHVFDYCHEGVDSFLSRTKIRHMRRGFRPRHIWVRSQRFSHSALWKPEFTYAHFCLCLVGDSQLQGNQLQGNRWAWPIFERVSETPSFGFTR